MSPDISPYQQPKTEILDCNFSNWILIGVNSILDGYDALSDVDEDLSDNSDAIPEKSVMNMLLNELVSINRARAERKLKTQMMVHH